MNSAHNTQPCRLSNVLLTCQIAAQDRLQDLPLLSVLLVPLPPMWWIFLELGLRDVLIEHGELESSRLLEVRHRRKNLHRLASDSFHRLDVDGRTTISDH